MHKIIVYKLKSDGFNDWVKKKEHKYEKEKFVSIKFEFDKSNDDEIFLVDEQKLWKFNI